MKHDGENTLIVGCGVNYAFNVFRPGMPSNFTYQEILPIMFKENQSELSKKFRSYLNSKDCNAVNFEEFLRLQKLSQNDSEDVKDEFIRVLGEKHRGWSVRNSMAETNFDTFKNNLICISRIYTTNFDLKFYYLCDKLNLFGNKKQEYTQFFNDCFYPKKKEKCKLDRYEAYPFQFGNDDIPCNLVYLHGSMHLFQDADGNCYKIANVKNNNLIDNRINICNNSFYNVFVLGGTTEEKLEIINRNMYLLDRLNSLSQIQGDVVIYGCSIDENDSHIWERLKCNNKIWSIYIGIPNNNSLALERIKKFFVTENKNIYTYIQEDFNIWICENWLDRIKNDSSEVII